VENEAYLDNQIPDIPQLDGEVLNKESEISEILQEDPVPVTLLSGDPMFEISPPEESLHVISLKEAPMLEEPLSENPGSIPHETAPQPNPHPPQFNPPPTPPPMLDTLPTDWRKVICQDCLQSSHFYHYYHCMNCHEYGPDWYKKSSK
jgi:hypothetical protein